MCDARIDGYRCARMRGHRDEIHYGPSIDGRHPLVKYWRTSTWVQRAREGRLPVKDWTAA